MKKWLVLLLGVVLLGSLVLVGCGTATEETTTTEEVTATTVAAGPAIDWADAAGDTSLVGQTVTVNGPCVAVVDKGEAIGKYLCYLGEEETGFDFMIEYADLDAVGGVDFLTGLKGKEVNITGEVIDNPFELHNEIQVKDASQIEVVGDAPADAAASSEAFTTEEAMNHYGETGTITGKVVGVMDLSSTDPAKFLIQLDFGDVDGSGANARVLAADVAAFGGLDALNLLIGKTVEITGLIEENQFQQKAEIELTEASQLVIQQ